MRLPSCPLLLQVDDDAFAMNFAEAEGVRLVQELCVAGASFMCEPPVPLDAIADLS